MYLGVRTGTTKIEYTCTQINEIYNNEKKEGDKNGHTSHQKKKRKNNTYKTKKISLCIENKSKTKKRAEKILKIYHMPYIN